MACTARTCTGNSGPCVLLQGATRWAPATPAPDAVFQRPRRTAAIAAVAAATAAAAAPVDELGLDPCADEQLSEFEFDEEPEDEWDSGSGADSEDEGVGGRRGGARSAMRKAAAVRALLLNGDFWDSMRLLYNVLHPLGQAIYAMESGECIAKKPLPGVSCPQSATVYGPWGVLPNCPCCMPTLMPSLYPRGCNPGRCLLRADEHGAGFQEASDRGTTRVSGG